MTWGAGKTGNIPSGRFGAHFLEAFYGFLNTSFSREVGEVARQFLAATRKETFMEIEIQPALYSPLDAARDCDRSAGTIKRIAAEIRVGRKTVGGVLVLTVEDVSKIKAELQRRQIEANR